MRHKPIAKLLLIMMGLLLVAASSGSPILIGLGLTLFLIAFWPKKHAERICAWCGSQEIEFHKGQQGHWYWKYRNKNGTPDKRVKDNFKLANFYSLFICKRCGAETAFNHFVSRNPSHKTKVCMRMLKKEGSGERTGSDWADKDGKTVRTTGEFRKGWE